jgi:hypothetical protein
MKVGIVHYKIGTDGVSLEIKKRAKILKRLGLKPYFIAGEGDADFVVPEISAACRAVMHFNSYAFGEDKEEKVRKMFFRLERRAEKKLSPVLEELNPDFLIVHNMFSMAYNLPASYALAQMIQQKNIKTEAVHHDFWWDRRVFKSHIFFIRDLMLDILPPNIPQIVSHVVINSIEREKLLKRRGIKAKVFGDLFEFEEIDGHPKGEIKKALKLKNEVVFLQATRIVKRKAIEVSIDLVNEFNKVSGRPGAIVLTNHPEKYIDREYLKFLKEYAKSKGVRLVEAYKSKKNIAFFEFYKIADFALYPTIKEGFGNQLLEAMYYKVIPIVFEYEVFRKDLKKEGYRYISLGQRYRTVDGLVKIPEKRLQQAVKKALYYLSHPKSYRAAVETNYKIASKYHAPKVLENYYRLLVMSIGVEKTLLNLKNLMGIPKLKWKKLITTLIKA